MQFPIGQDVGFVKAHLQRVLGVPASDQTFTVAGQVMIDPLSLRDYDVILTNKPGSVVEIDVRVAADAK
jgi:hypothetical protein